MTHAFVFSMVFNLLCDLGRQGGVPKFMKNDRFKVFLAVWFLFHKVFWQVKKWLILKLHEMIRVLQVVACPINFILLCDLFRSGGVPKPTKNNPF